VKIFSSSFRVVQLVAPRHLGVLSGFDDFAERSVHEFIMQEYAARPSWLFTVNYGFEKVIAMIDEMVASLKKEQSDDETKKKYCAEELDSSDDKKKELERSVSDSDAAIASTTEGIATLTMELAALETGILALDKSVAEATEQRKEENAAQKELMASDGAAKELLGFAKNRLNRFYNPKLYKAPPALLAQVSAHVQDKVAPPPPPESPGPYKKKSEEQAGVIQMIDMLITDLEKEMAASTAEEKDAQADYELLMKDSAEKRLSDSASITDKTATKAEMEGELEAHTDAKASSSKDLSATMEFIASLHAECDWLLQYFEVRKEARASEIDALGKAKAVLSGADYALLQTGSRSLRVRSA
jgi:L-lactate utilization protein LutC